VFLGLASMPAVRIGQAVGLLALVGFSTVLWLVGLSKLLAVALVLLWALYLSLDRLLGRLAGWAIGRTPKAFRWTIECICVRPSFSWRPHAWSEVTIVNWTWHNPPGFEGADILHIDRLTLRLNLASIYRALRHHDAVEVDMLLLEGVCFCTQRNEEAELNLWEALDLPDSDVNVSAIVQNARRHGGMHTDTFKKRASWAAVKPLPAVSTEATRKAAKYTRPEWLRRTQVKFKPPSTTRCFPCLCCSDSSSSSSAPSAAGPYFEFPIGDPRRRPRWGVPMRFNIRQMAVMDVKLHVFDLLTLDHRWRLLGPGDTKMVVSSLFISREHLEAGDERRSGSGPVGDRIHGVYLGELIWVLIAQLLPKVIEHSPSNFFKTAAFATGYCVRDSAVTAAAKVLDFMLDAKHFVAMRLCLPRALGEASLTPTDHEGGCQVHVHLIRGRGIAHEGQRVNVHARLELCDPPPRCEGQAVVAGSFARGSSVDTQYSALRIWTKTPWWDQHFSLGPAGSVHSVLRITLFFRKTRHANAAISRSEDAKIGEVNIPLRTLLVRDRVIRDNQMVGWFPLEPARAAGRGASHFKGRLKLGLKLNGRSQLRDLEAC